ncbi:MAG TPA: type II toxin-antitoxin system RelE/ParE family toxin [Acidobacteriaceae bacterium]
MIVSFRHKGLKLFYETSSIRGIQAQHAAKLRRILTALEFAAGPDDLMQQSGLKPHPLTGRRIGFWSMWVNGNWRVTFRFVQTNVELIDYEDYH